MKKLLSILCLITFFVTTASAQSWTETFNGDPDYYGSTMEFPQANPVTFNYGTSITDSAYLDVTVHQPTTHINGEIDISFVEAYINFYDADNNFIGSSDFIQESFPSDQFSIKYKVAIPSETVKVEFYYAINGFDLNENWYANEQLVVLER